MSYFPLSREEKHVTTIDRKTCNTTMQYNLNTLIFMLTKSDLSGLYLSCHNLALYLLSAVTPGQVE
jgi:hypothetical protein